MILRLRLGAIAKSSLVLPEIADRRIESPAVGIFKALRVYQPGKVYDESNWSIMARRFGAQRGLPSSGSLRWRRFVGPDFERKCRQLGDDRLGCRRNNDGKWRRKRHDERWYRRLERDRKQHGA